eukprot:7266094-Prorocentrum_lima.AAC.1
MGQGSDTRSPWLRGCTRVIPSLWESSPSSSGSSWMPRPSSSRMRWLQRTPTDIIVVCDAKEACDVYTWTHLRLQQHGIQLNLDKTEIWKSTPASVLPPQLQACV